jgi:hypothetical protein
MEMAKRKKKINREPECISCKNWEKREPPVNVQSATRRKASA